MKNEVSLRSVLERAAGINAAQSRYSDIVEQLQNMCQGGVSVNHSAVKMLIDEARSLEMEASCVGATIRVEAMYRHESPMWRMMLAAKAGDPGALAWQRSPAGLVTKLACGIQHDHLLGDVVVHLAQLLLNAYVGPAHVCAAINENLSGVRLKWEYCDSHYGGIKWTVELRTPDRFGNMVTCNEISTQVESPPVDHVDLDSAYFSKAKRVNLVDYVDIPAKDRAVSALGNVLGLMR